MTNRDHAILSVETFQGPTLEWDAAVRRMPASSFCHLGGWRAVLSDTLGQECILLIAREDDGAIQGLLPITHVKSLLFGSYLVSMPFVSYGGPIGSAGARHRLAEAAVGLAGRLRVDLLELRSRSGLDTTALQTSHRKLTVTMALPQDVDVLWNEGLRAKVRSQIRRPMKEGMTVRFGLDQVESFYEVFSLTMRDLGTPVLPRSFFDALARTFPSEVVFGVVEHRGRPVAAGCGFGWLGEMEITWAGSDRALSRLAPNMLLYWSFMEESIRRGMTTFNFGRCTEGSGTHHFKRQWPSVDEPLPWAQWSPTGVVSTPNPDSAKFALARSAWTRLPVAVANRIGPLLARSLP